MPKFVSDLQSSLSSYVHPDLVFLDVLNEVLPQLASKGIWRDLTFEETLNLSSTDRFFTLPEEADSALHAMVNNTPAPIKPLWNAFVNEGASTGRMGSFYGVEDAGYSPTKDILSHEHHYALVIFPRWRWGEVDDKSDVYTDTAFDGTETVTVVYENWEGIIKTSTDTISASADPQLLSPRGVRNIRSISYSDFDAVPGLVVAVPVLSLSLHSAAPGGTTTYALPEFDEDTDYTEFGSTPLDLKVYSLRNDDAEVSDNDVTYTSVAASLMFSGTDLGPPNFTDHPVMLMRDSFLTDVLTKTNEAEDAKKVCECGGAGIARYRLFRQQSAGNSVHLLLRRKIPKFTSGTDIVYLDNQSALKYAFLANTAEYNNDIKQARSWWKEAVEELNNDLSKSLGAAHPNPRFDPSGGMGGVENIQ